jgi:Fur family transcriptional regulator, ferric uptake regulator
MERQTRQKQAVMQAIETSGRSLNAAEIWSLAQREVPSLNLSTVYRQIKALHDDAQVLRVDLPGQPPRYEALCHAPRTRGRDHHHHHFHCTGCEQVFPIHGCPGGMERLAPKGFQVQSHDLTLHGRCATCASA